MPLLTHGRFHEQPQRQRRSRPHGSECSSSVGGTSLSLERNLGNRKRPHSPNNQVPGWRSAHSHAALMIEVENYLLMWHFELSYIWCNCSHCEGLYLFLVLGWLSDCFQCLSRMNSSICMYASFLNWYNRLRLHYQYDNKSWTKGRGNACTASLSNIMHHINMWLMQCQWCWQ